MYKAVILDFFNVIHRDPFIHWLSQNGLERKGELEEIPKQFDLGNINLEEHHRRVSKASGKPIDGVKAAFDDTSFIDAGMVALIKRLKRTYKIALLSNSAMEYIGQILDRHDLEPLFDVITVSAEVGMAKPDRRIFQHMLNELGVTAEEAIFIDDNPHNVEAAVNLGIQGIVYKDIGSLKKELSETGVSI